MDFESFAVRNIPFFITDFTRRYQELSAVSLFQVKGGQLQIYT